MTAHQIRCVRYSAGTCNSPHPRFTVDRRYSKMSMLPSVIRFSSQNRPINILVWFKISIACRLVRRCRGRGVRSTTFFAARKFPPLSGLLVIRLPRMRLWIKLLVIQRLSRSNNGERSKSSITRYREDLGRERRPRSEVFVALYLAGSLYLRDLCSFVGLLHRDRSLCESCSFNCGAAAAVDGEEESCSDPCSLLK